ncbi:MAG: PAS domain S-box protein [Gallionella sp.]|nr:PAS domain S-box protein [Gallionella sp.]
MLEPMMPFDEASRLATLRGLNILDTPAEDRFDRFTRLAQQLMCVPIAVISLIDSNRQWFKSCQGLDASETPRSISFCGHTILEDQTLIIPDARLDIRFADNPLVIEAPYIRFYAGAPLKLHNGQRVGTLCVIDRQPHQPSAAQQLGLRDLAQCVSEELEHGQWLKEAAELFLLQEKYAAIIATSDDAIMSKTLDGMITTWNPAAERLFGYTESEALGQSMMMLVPQDKADEAPPILTRIQQGERVEHFETVWIKKDGCRVDVSVSISPMKDSAGKIIGASQIVRDITERIQVTQERLADERRIREAQHIAKVGSWDLDLVSGKLIWSDEIYNLFEMDQSQFGASYEAFLDAIHPDDRDAVNHAYTESLVSRSPYEVTHRLLMGDGRIKWVHEHCTSDFDAEGKPLRSRGTVQDFTALRMAEYAAQESTLRTQAILDNVLDGIMTISQHGMIESFNKASENIFGYPAAEIIGSGIKILMPELYHSDQDGYLHNYVKTFHKKFICIGEQVVGRRKDGSTFPIDLAVSEMQLGDKRVFTGIVRDITERVKVERMKSEFISTVSHELRTPLTSIRGSLALIVGGVVGELPAKIKPLIEIAHKNSERLILLVNDILDMEKIEAGKMEFDMQPTELMPLLAQALEGNRAYGEQYKVSYVLANTLPEMMIKVDSNRLMQVFANLLSNAAKFSPSGDKVLVAVECMAQQVRVSVKDHGSGIPDAFKGQIFQKFAQADASDTKKKGGTGLGLSITKAIIEQMGGSIGFTSHPNVETTFFVEFPIWNPAENTPPVLATASDRKHVLICEDDRDVAELLRIMLEQSGLVADVAYDAAQAKQLLAQRSYAAMTLDLSMPNQDGISLIRELRASPATATLPIVVVSANANEGRKVLNSDAFSVIDWIEKPIDQVHLASALRQAVGRVADGMPKVLHVEDDPDIAHVVSMIVGEIAKVENARTLADARRMLQNGHYDLAILDISLPDGSSMELLPTLNLAVPAIPVMVFSATEVLHDDLSKIKSALVKSRTYNGQLLTTIKRLIEGD